ncbi:MAG: enoyl-CoA hydratase/isomerase family protein [Acidimicrobiales bacterium]|nr:enoyl-CoA hydratase/isomerase family protein [Acidimicrobiales bacterium]
MSTDSPFETLAVAVDGAIGRLELARPARLNAMSRQLLRELAAAAAWFDDHGEVKVVVVTGQGRAFCAGFDLGDFTTADDAGLSPRDGADLGRVMAEAVTGMRALTIAGIHGHCVGGGLVLAAACDLRVAAADAVFSIPEVDLGIPLAWGGIPRLVREIGPALTKELVLTCRAFDAREALAVRFLNRVVEPDRLQVTLDELAASLAAKSALTLQVTKRQVNAVAEEMGSTAHAFVDGDVLASALADPESRAAGRSYLERRRPRG